jgi:PIN domain nuclease of toxin-antitoxin system
MKVLIDTHAFIWWTSNSQKLTPAVYSLITNPMTDVVLSIVSIWEIQIKLSLGKIELKTNLPELIDCEVRCNRIELLHLSLFHIYELNNLPHYHKDPFDRLLIAQAKFEKLSIVSIDDKFNDYEIDRLWE